MVSYRLAKRSNEHIACNSIHLKETAIRTARTNFQLNRFTAFRATSLISRFALVNVNPPINTATIKPHTNKTAFCIVIVLCSFIRRRLAR
ncbi:MAG: hypothetical protein LBC74_13405 [Planctomycetaceae bacterium]|nr:hypothetical protein [Planctomycetaceae bacterium]